MYEDLSNKDLTINNNLISYEHLVSNWEFKEEYERQFSIKFSFNSGKIENDGFNYNDTREIFERGSVSSYTGDVNTLIEQVNQKNCMDLVFNSSLELSLDLVKLFHFTLMNGCMTPRLIAKGEQAGQFKKGDYAVGKNDIVCLPEEVEGELEFIVDQFNEVVSSVECPSKLKSEKALKIVTYFHAWFESIHPFADGNGRTGRMIMNWMLIKLGHPPIVVFEEDRNVYYDALEDFNETEDLDRLFKFFKFESVKTWSDVLTRKSSNRNKPSNSRLKPSEFLK